MKPQLIAIATTSLFACASGWTAIVVADLGTAAPPATLGGYTMTAFTLDARPLLTHVADVPSPLGGVVAFSSSLEHRAVPVEWSTWSHGYTGDVYFSDGQLAVTLGLPSGTVAFYLYAQPNTFHGVHDITAEANDGTLLTLSISGDGGAKGFGFYATAGSSLTSIMVSGPIEFAVGGFGIAVPEPGAYTALAGLGLMAFIASRRVRRTPCS